MTVSNTVVGRARGPESATRILNQACRTITQAGYRPVAAGKERELHHRLKEALREHDPITEGRLAHHGCGWTRKPGGVDVVARGLSLGIEVKLDKPDELLWDAIKVGQRVDPDAGWDEALGIAAVVDQTTVDRLHSPDAYMLWPAAPKTFDVRALLDERRRDWYWLMCGGRGVRPTNLPRYLRASETQVHPYQDNPATVLAVRAFWASSSATERFELDEHGWPHDMEVPAEWRDRIDFCATRKAGVEIVGRIPTRSKPMDEEDVQIRRTQLTKDEGTCKWAFVWAPGFEHPTSFRLSPEDPERYDLRVSSNKAVTNPGAPKPLPEWCRASVCRARQAS